MSLTISSLTRFYLFNPYKLPEKEDRILALATSIILGVLTLGIMHAVCFAFLYDKNFVQKHTKNAVETKTEATFEKEIVRKRSQPPIRKKKRRPHTPSKDKNEVPALVPQAITTEPEYITYKKHTHVRLADFKKKAEEGNGLYQRFLGTQYFFGYQGLPKSKPQAAYWFAKAAERNNYFAQCRLGIMYYQGDGVEKSEEKGIGLIRKSAARKFSEAIKFLEHHGLNEKHVHFAK